MSTLSVLEFFGARAQDVNLGRLRDPYYYVNDIWNDISDPGVNSKPFMSGGPWGWVAVLSLIVLWIRVLGPRYMAHRPAADFRAWLLVLNGLTFGGYITGFITGIWYANWGLDALSCSSYDQGDSSVEMWIKKSVGYVFFGGKVWDFMRPLLAVFRKRDHEITNLYLFHCACAVFFVFLGLKLHPGGVFIFLPYLDGVYQIVAQAYLVMAATAGAQMKPSYEFRVFLYRLRLFSGVLVLVHGLYFLTVPNCGPTFLKLFQVIYAAIGLALGPSEWNKMESLRLETLRRRSLESCKKYT
ncbi:Elongation of very long chain fatty acids protein 1 [Halotydeus destructor]|nr:Elongation of very long chain fatty acids protein 1 [Halotydeus destructor]